MSKKGGIIGSVRRARTMVLALATLATSLALNSAEAAAPGNDNWADSLEVTLPYSATVDLTDASAEFGENSCYWQQNTRPSVWFKLTATETAYHVASTFSAEVATEVGVYTGSGLKDLTVIGCRSYAAGYSPRVAWKPTVGQTYFVRVAAFDDKRVDFSLSVPPPPAHDAMANARPIEYSQPLEYEHFSEENANAGNEGEPVPPCLSSLWDSPTVWYRLSTPAQVGHDFVFHSLSYFYAPVAIWEQQSDASLISLGCATDRPSRVSPKPNTTYYFQLIDSYRYGQPVGIHLHPSLPNDHFEEAEAITELPFSSSGNLYNATVQPGEKRASCSYEKAGTVWYRYTASSTRVLKLSSKATGVTWVAAYRGSHLAQLQELGCRSGYSSGADLSIEVRSGETIYIQTGDPELSNSTVTLTVSDQAPVANDGPQEARDINLTAMLESSTSQDTLLARLSAGEPAPSCGLDPGSTVWFKMTAAVSAKLIVETPSSNYDTVLALYDSNLSEKACNDDVGKLVTSRITLEVEQGQTYVISASGTKRSRGNLSLRIRAASAVNDNFADARAITSHPYADTESTQFATLEAGEPQPSADCIGTSSPNTIGFTIWYRFTPSQDMSLTASVAGNNLQTLVAVYTGSGLTALSQVACTAAAPNVVPGVQSPRVHAAKFDAKAGVTYYFQVGHRATAGSRAVPFQLTRTDGVIG